MTNFKVYHSARFNRELSKLGVDFQRRVDKIEDEISENPYTGKPLNVKWFREKRYGSHRIYYLVYEDLKSVIFVGISDKDNQQQVINTNRLLFSYFREEIEKLLEKDFD